MTRHRRSPAGPGRLRAPGRPPLTAALAAALIAVPLAAQEPTDLREEVEVGRVIVDLRVVDRHARPVLGLGPGDLVVTVAGKEVRLESVDWITGATPSLDDMPAEEVERVRRERGPGHPGRLIVLLFQRHTLPSRIVGLMHMLRRADEFVGSLGPDDRVAILTFDSHLRLFSDFTDDHAWLETVLRERIVPYRPPPRPEAGPFPSIAAHFDHEAARDAATPEMALLVVARALKPLRGSKTLLFVGYGMGVRTALGVEMRPEYVPARRALVDARVSVFPLDVTRADYHSLEGPLIRLARDTGGYCMKTYYSSYFAMDSVVRIVQGRYELVFDKPDLPPGLHPIRVRLRHRRDHPRSQLFFREYYDNRLADRSPGPGAP